jgi:hypothetical protein
MRIRIQDVSLMRIHANPDPQPCNHNYAMHHMQSCGSVLILVGWIRSVGKNDPPQKKKVTKVWFEVLDVLFWRLEVSRCSLDVLHGSLGINIKIFEKNAWIFQLEIFTIFGHQIPGSALNQNGESRRRQILIPLLGNIVGYSVRLSYSTISPRQGLAFGLRLDVSLRNKVVVFT